MRFRWWFVFVLAFAFAAAAQAATLYVSPAGRPEWSGSLEKPNAAQTDGPLPSLTAARDKIRQSRRGGPSEPMTVLLCGGTYFLTEPFVLTPEDSDVTYAACAGQRAILSGGRRIEGWQKGNGPRWTAPAPFVFRQMFIDGRRAQRSRAPNQGFYRIDGRAIKNNQNQYVFKYRGNDIRKSWAEQGDVEVIAIPGWQEARQPIVEVDEAAHTVRLAGNVPKPAGLHVDACYWIENAPDTLDWFGEWYLDRRAHTVTYQAMRDETLSAQEVIAPALVTLVRLEGSPESGKLVRHVVFRNLEFRHADWTLGPRGYTDMQSANIVPAALEATGAEEVTVEHCRFTQCGGYAVSFGRGSKHNRVLANEISDMGAGGIRIGEPLMNNPRENDADRNGHNTVADNSLHQLGRVFPGAAGILLLQSSFNTVAHNHVYDLFHNAISVGWTWKYQPDQSQGNIVEFNHLHDLGQNVMSDMGGIYTLGEQPDTVLRNNLIHDVNCLVYGGWGIYLDQATSEIVVENNIVYNCKTAGFNQHFGRENTICNNIFALNKEYQMTRDLAEKHRSFSFERNIVLVDEGELLGHNWRGGFTMNQNLYWDTRGFPIRPAGNSWRQWQQSGQDKDSLIADPRFQNVANFDFRLRSDSPAWKLGFKPIDLSSVGPRVEVGPVADRSTQ